MKPATSAAREHKPAPIGHRVSHSEEHAGMVDLGADGDPDNR